MQLATEEILQDVRIDIRHLGETRGFEFHRGRGREAWPFEYQRINCT
jgi:hypothetical protein